MRAAVGAHIAPRLLCVSPISQLWYRSKVMGSGEWTRICDNAPADGN
jgi:hypothetical protein